MTIPGLKHVVRLNLENQNLATIVGPKSTAPFLNGLAKANAYCSAYKGRYAVSLPNYEAGAFASTLDTTDVEPPSAHQHSEMTIYDLVEGSGGTWGVFAEDYPPPLEKDPYLGPTILPFSAHHVVANYSSRITQNAKRQALVQPIAKFDPTNLPTFADVIPDNDHNSHNSPTDVPASDAWCKTFLGPLLASPQMAETLLEIVYDNAWSPPLSVSPAILVGPSVKPGSVWKYNSGHYHLLRTTEEVLGLGTLTKNDKNAAPIDVFA